MRGRLWLKLKSNRGASILMAMLFLLVCMLVSSSVLMAAGSNAGKRQSNYQEQQKYLALSSALRLVCDDICAARYIGQYAYNVAPHYAYDDEGHSHLDYYIHTYTMQPGGWQSAAGATAALGDLLPLNRDLDAWLAGNFTLPVSEWNAGDKYIFDTDDPLINKSFNGHYQLLLTPGIDGVEKVNVDCVMREDGVIRLTATLGEAAADGYLYTMEAELLPAPGWAETLKPQNAPGSALNTMAAVSWELNWIAKKEAGV